MGNERDTIISFLLQACDAKNRQIEELQKLVTEFQKREAALESKDKESLS